MGALNVHKILEMLGLGEEEIRRKHFLIEVLSLVICLAGCFRSCPLLLGLEGDVLHVVDAIHRFLPVFLELEDGDGVREQHAEALLFELVEGEVYLRLLLGGVDVVRLGPALGVEFNLFGFQGIDLVLPFELDLAGFLAVLEGLGLDPGPDFGPGEIQALYQLFSLLDLLSLAGLLLLGVLPLLLVQLDRCNRLPLDLGIGLAQKFPVPGEGVVGCQGVVVGLQTRRIGFP
jgi:hypothetical protein